MSNIDVNVPVDSIINAMLHHAMESSDGVTAVRTLGGALQVLLHQRDGNPDDLDYCFNCGRDDNGLMACEQCERWNVLHRDETGSRICLQCSGRVAKKWATGKDLYCRWQLVADDGWIIYDQLFEKNPVA